MSTTYQVLLACALVGAIQAECIASGRTSHGALSAQIGVKVTPADLSGARRQRYTVPLPASPLPWSHTDSQSTRRRPTPNLLAPSKIVATVPWGDGIHTYWWLSARRLLVFLGGVRGNAQVRAYTTVARSQRMVEHARLTELIGKVSAHFVGCLALSVSPDGTRILLRCDAAPNGVRRMWACLWIGGSRATWGEMPYYASLASAWTRDGRHWICLHRTMTHPARLVLVDPSPPGRLTERDKPELGTGPVAAGQGFTFPEPFNPIVAGTTPDGYAVIIGWPNGGPQARCPICLVDVLGNRRTVYLGSAHFPAGFSAFDFAVDPGGKRIAWLAEGPPWTSLGVHALFLSRLDGSELREISRSDKGNPDLFWLQWIPNGSGVSLSSGNNIYLTPIPLDKQIHGTRPSRSRRHAEAKVSSDYGSARDLHARWHVRVS